MLASFSDFEDCDMISYTADIIHQLRIASSEGSKKAIDIQLNSRENEDSATQENLKIVEVRKGGLIVSSYFSSKQSELFDGFFCVDSSEPQENRIEEQNNQSASGKTSTAPCKKYLHYTDGQPNPNLSLMKCFRIHKDPGSNVSVIIVLNRTLDRDPNIFVKLADLDSHILNSRFLFSTIKFISDSMKGIVPIMSTEKSLSEFFWINGKNLITEMSNDGKMFVRYRFIDTTTNPEPTELQRHELIKGAFYLIKRFFYQKRSCKQIIDDAYLDGYLEVLEEDQSFPRNYRHIMMWLEEKCNDKLKLNLTTKDKHKILLQLSAMAYCKQSVQYDKTTLNSLKEMIGSIFSQDQFFTSNQMQSEFKKYFSDSKNMFTIEKYTGKPKDQELIESILDEPFLESELKKDDEVKSERKLIAII